MPRCRPVARAAGRLYYQSGGGDDLRPIFFADHPDAELLRFLELRASSRAGHNEIGLSAHRCRRPRTEAFGLCLGFVAAHGLETAGEDDRLAAPLGLPGVADKGL